VFLSGCGSFLVLRVFIIIVYFAISGRNSQPIRRIIEGESHSKRLYVSCLYLLFCQEVEPYMHLFVTFINTNFQTNYTVLIILKGLCDCQLSNFCTFKFSVNNRLTWQPYKEIWDHSFVKFCYLYGIKWENVWNLGV